MECQFIRNENGLYLIDMETGYAFPYRRRYDGDYYNAEFFEDWIALTKTKRMKFRRKYAPDLMGRGVVFSTDETRSNLENKVTLDMQYLTTSGWISVPTAATSIYNPPNYSLAYCNEAQTVDIPEKKRDYGCIKEEEKETNMSHYDATERLINRLSSIRNDKYHELRKTFGLTDDATPESLNEFIARLTSGKFTFPQDKRDSKWGIYSILDSIRWRDPSKKEDEAGFEIAAEKLADAYASTQDEIIVKTPTDPNAGLAALNSFKAATFQ